MHPDVHKGPLQRVTEHGQEWLTCYHCGAQWGIHDSMKDMDDYRALIGFITLIVLFLLGVMVLERCAVPERIPVHPSRHEI
jgi:hypothetical protein